MYGVGLEPTLFLSKTPELEFGVLICSGQDTKQYTELKKIINQNFKITIIGLLIANVVDSN